MPFNKGQNLGAGNPTNPGGHKTAYLWEEIFSKASVANIIQHFVRIDGSSKDPLSKRSLFFPRYRQLDVVRRLVRHASENGAGKPIGFSIRPVRVNPTPFLGGLSADRNLSGRHRYAGSH
ncbi:MAG: hypothetical protein ACXV79_03330 [Methylobacter sp.]